MDQPSAKESGGFLVSSIGYATASGFRQTLVPLGLHPREFAILRELTTHSGASQQDLSRTLHVPGGRMVGLIDNLERNGLLRRDSHDTDRRRYCLRLTQDGRNLLNRAQTAAATYEAALFEGFSTTDRRELERLLRKLAQALDLPLGAHPGMSASVTDGEADLESMGKTP